LTEKQLALSTGLEIGQVFERSCIKDTTHPRFVPVGLPGQQTFLETGAR
jgi:hypothetical protein